MRKLTTAALLAVMLAVAAPAYAETGPKEHFELAQKLAEMKEHTRAVTVLRSMMMKWPDETKFVPLGHILLADSLHRLGKTEEAIDVLDQALARYGDNLSRDNHSFRREASLLRARLHRRLNEKRQSAHYLEELERSLKEQGLRGEELRREYDRLARAYHEARESHDEARVAVDRAEREKAQLEAMIKFWQDGGATPEEIAERRAMFEAERAINEAMRAKLRDEAEALKAAGVANEERTRRLEEMRRRLTAEQGTEWEARRERDMAELRREFLHLAERLGIPGDDAERFLEEHRRRRFPARVAHDGHAHDGHPEASDEPFSAGRPADRHDRGAGNIAARMDRLERALSELVPHLQQTLLKLNERLEKLEQAARDR